MRSETPLGGELRYLRELRGLPLRRLAEQVGVSPAYLSKVERGEIRAPSPVHLNNLSAALGVDPAQVLGLAGYLPRRGGLGRRAGNEYSLAGPNGVIELTGQEAIELADFVEWKRERMTRSRGGDWNEPNLDSPRSSGAPR